MGHSIDVDPLVRSMDASACHVAETGELVERNWESGIGNGGWCRSRGQKQENKFDLGKQTSERARAVGKIHGRCKNQSEARV